MAKTLQARYNLEYVAFLHFQMNTIQDGPVHLFFAVDAFSGYAFNLGAEPELNAEAVLKNIYLMCEIPEFREQNTRGFTLVLDDFEAIMDRIEAVIRPENGKVIFNKGYNNFITNPLLISIDQYLSSR